MEIDFKEKLRDDGRRLCNRGGNPRALTDRLEGGKGTASPHASIVAQALSVLLCFMNGDVCARTLRWTGINFALFLLQRWRVFFKAVQRKRKLKDATWVATGRVLLVDGSFLSMLFIYNFK